jgi:hypothetical protein
MKKTKMSFFENEGTKKTFVFSSEKCQSLGCGWVLKKRRHDIQHNDTKHNETQHNEIHKDDTQFVFKWLPFGANVIKLFCP